MDYVFAWQNLQFFIPILFGVLLIVGAAFGVGHDADTDIHADVDFHADADVHAELDTEIDADGDGIPDFHHAHLEVAHGNDGHDGHVPHEQSFLNKVLQQFGVGRVPLTIVMMMASLTFGGTGIVANAFLETLVAKSGAFALLSTAIAFTVMLLLTGRMALLVSKIMPTEESAHVKKRDLVGAVGELVISTDADFGTAQVRDQHGNLHNVTCRTAKGALPPGERVVVVSFEQKERVYVVEPFSKSLNNPGAAKVLASRD